MEYARNRAEEARLRFLARQAAETPDESDRVPEPQSPSPRFTFLKRISGGITGRVRSINWWYPVAGFVVLAGIIWLLTNPPSFRTIDAVRLGGPQGASFTIRFIDLAFLATIVFGFIEASDRRDPLRLDWWLPYVVWGTLVYYGMQGPLTAVGGLIIGTGLGALLIGAFWNRAEEQQESWLERFDTSGVFTLSFALVLTHLANWATIPYPSFVPLPLVYAVAALALLKELLRSFLFGISVLVLGAIAGFFMSWAAIAITFALTVAAVYIGGWQEWIPTRGSRRDWSTQNYGRFEIKLIKAWDVMFAWWAVFVVTGLHFYANFPLIILSR